MVLMKLVFLFVMIFGFVGISYVGCDFDIDEFNILVGYEI